MKALCSELLPLATVITPNLDESQLLWGCPIRSVEDMQVAARAIGERFGAACVVKGGHLGKVFSVQRSVFREKRSQVGEQGSEINRQSAINNRQSVTDVLYDGKATKLFSLPRVTGVKTHGTGCMFSAALTAFLACGEKLPTAVNHAKHFVASKLKCHKVSGNL